MLNNGDAKREFKVGKEIIRGLGSFHKTLPHNKWGEVDPVAFAKLVAACESDGWGFADVPKGSDLPVPLDAAPLTNPQAGLAFDRLVQFPGTYAMPPAPCVLSQTTAAEMTELYWMALLRDLPFAQFGRNELVEIAAIELDHRFRQALDEPFNPGRLQTGRDVPGPEGAMKKITAQNLFRLGLPGEDVGPWVSQFWLRDVPFGTQRIDQKQQPYRSKLDYLTRYDEWLKVQNIGKDEFGQAYSMSNQHSDLDFENQRRYISTPRDMARFVNKAALHQACFNTCLILLAGGAHWTTGNPYREGGRLAQRETGFAVLGQAHILALVSEVASRALKVVWNQKWQVHLRLRPEAYGGLVHVQTKGIGGPDGKRPYGLPKWVADTEAALRIRKTTGSLLLPMAYTTGSPIHPAYGAGHATVAGMCVTILKAFFQTFETVNGKDVPIRFTYDKKHNPKGLTERVEPFGPATPISTYVPDIDGTEGILTPLAEAVADQLTIEGELNKLAMNVAMGCSMGGVHWRTDNTRSLLLGEALAARVLADITIDTNECPQFVFRSFARRADGEPKKINVRQGRIYVDENLAETNSSAL